MTSDPIDTEPEIVSGTETENVSETDCSENEIEYSRQKFEQIRQKLSTILHFYQHSRQYSLTLPSKDIYIISIDGQPIFYVLSEKEAREAILLEISLLVESDPEWEYHIYVTDNIYKVSRTYKWFFIQHDEYHCRYQYDKISRQ
jgi:hypothetical protein